MASLSDALPSSVPKLDTSGTNWAIFVFRFQDAVEAKGFWGHFDGSMPTPVFADAANPMTDETPTKAQWDKNERSAKSLLTQKLLDSTVVMAISILTKNFPRVAQGGKVPKKVKKGAERSEMWEAGKIGSIF